MASNGGKLERDKLSWPQGPWDRIDAVHDEVKRTGSVRRFIPVVPCGAGCPDVAADTVTVNIGEPVAANKRLLQVNESAVTEIIEIWVEFWLTHQQAEREATVIDPSPAGCSRDDPGADGGVPVTVAFPTRCGR